MGDNTNHEDRSPLLPDRHPQQDFFVCDIFDAAPKGDMASMEHPIFSVSTKPDFNKRAYAHGDAILRVSPSGNGLATVHDRDVLIYCISQIMAALNEGKQVSQVVRFKAHDLLIATNRGTDGRGYEQLKAAFKRLQGTQVETNITTGGQAQWDVFSLLDRASIIRETFDGRMLDVEVKLSDWVFNAIRANEVLTIHRDYFRLRKPLERRIYELARKHCGTQKSWKIGLEKLHKKTGSSSTEKEFRRLVRNIIRQDEQHNHMPDYSIRMDASDILEFVNRRGEHTGKIGQGRLAFDASPSPHQLKPDTFTEARAAAPGWDIYYLETEWRSWTTEPPRNLDAAFVGFCRQWFEKRGRP